MNAHPIKFLATWLKTILLIVSMLFSASSTVSQASALTSPAFGITIITHGYQPTTSYPAWLDDMANAINTRMGGNTPIYTIRIISDGTGWVRLDPLSNPIVLNTNTGGSAIIKVDWSAVATGDCTFASFDYIPTVAVAQLVFTALTAHNNNPISVPIHLIGHSRGASVMSSLAKKLGQIGVWVDQYTALDAHPLVDGCLPGLADDPVNSWSNVLFSDSYYRDYDQNQTFPLPPSSPPYGRHVEGASEVYLNGIIVSQKPLSAHTQVHTYYHGTIEPQRVTPVDGETIQSAWYDTTLTPQRPARNQTGYVFSRNAFGQDARPSSGLHPDLGGSGARAALPAGMWPNVYLKSPTGYTYTAGDVVYIPYYYQGGNSTLDVTFSLDDDTNPFNTVATRCQKTVGSFPGLSSSTTIMPGIFSWTTTNADVGTCYLQAKATDPSGHVRYDYLLNPITIALSPAVTPVTVVPSPISNPRVFAYAEAKYSSLFAGTPTSGQYQQYDYRYYPSSKNYLAVDTSGTVYTMGPVSGGKIQSVGKVEDFRKLITAWESSQPAAPVTQPPGSTVAPPTGGTPPPPPSAPSGLAALAASSYVSLAWNDNSSNETGFKVERKTGVSGSWSQVASVGKNIAAYLDYGVTAGITYYYRVSAYNASGSSGYSNEASVTIASPTPALSITTTSLPSATAGAGYVQGVAVSGGQPPYAWSVSSGLPVGLNNSTTGVIFGTPSVPGTYYFTVTATDSSSPQKTALQALSITVVNPVAPTPTVSTATPSTPPPPTGTTPPPPPPPSPAPPPPPTGTTPPPPPPPSPAPPPPTPTVSAATPSTLTQGTGTQSVTIAGSHFTSASYHYFSTDGQSSWYWPQIAPTFNNPNSMTVQVNTSGLTAGTVVYIKVCASYASSTCSTTSVPVTIQAAAVSIPATPTGAATSGVIGASSGPGPVTPSSTVNMSWNTAGGAANYNLIVTDVTGNTQALSYPLPDNTYTWSFTAGHQYSWKVAACNATGCSPYTAAQYFQTPGAVAATPTVSTATPSTLTQGTGTQSVTIAGSNFTSASYHYFSTDGQSSWYWPQITPTFNNPNSMTVQVNTSGLTAGTVVYIKVCASYASSTCSPTSVPVTIQAATPAAKITVGPASLNFGNVPVGSCSSAVFAIQSLSGSGTASGTVDVGMNPPFSISAGNSSFSVSNGSAANVTVQFCPTSASSYTGTATVTSNATFTGANFVALSGTGTAPTCNSPQVLTNGVCVTPTPAAKITVGPATLNFGNVEVGKCGSAIFAIQHVSGTASASGTVNISPNPPFSIYLGSSFTVSNGSATNVSIQFCPTSASSYSGTATITSNAAFTGGSSVALSGTATPTVIPLAITTASPLLGGKVGTGYNVSLGASGGTPPYAWSLVGTQLPQGLSLSSTGIISGTPITAGTASFQAQATDSAQPPQTVQKPLSISIVGIPPGQLTMSAVNECSAATPQVRLTWTQASNVDYYQVYKDGSVLTGVSTTLPSYLDTAVVLGSTHSYFIRAVNSGGTADSNMANISASCTVTTPPGQFTLSAFTNCNGSSPQNILQPTWSAGAVLPYSIYRDGVLLTNLGAQYTDTAVTPGASYTYYARASNSAGSTNSNSIVNPVFKTVV